MTIFAQQFQSQSYTVSSGKTERIIDVSLDSLITWTRLKDKETLNYVHIALDC